MTPNTNAAPTIARTLDAARAAVEDLRTQGRSVALVPTMGCLHAGHGALIRRAHQLATAVCVSIFVNPKQFGPKEDFIAYPRRFDDDRAFLQAERVALIYAPDVTAMYPEGFATTVRVASLTDALCGATRPGHFDGVATVVAKLLLQLDPDIAVFGEKDYQQVQMIRRLTQDLNFPTQIVACPTVREADGLALSSRNLALTSAQRSLAPALYKTLKTVAAAAAMSDIPGILRQGAAALRRSGFDSLDYLTVCDERTLMPLSRLHPGIPARVFGAAWLGTTRLIDNIAIASTLEA